VLYYVLGLDGMGTYYITQRTSGFRSEGCCFYLLRNHHSGLTRFVTARASRNCGKMTPRRGKPLRNQNLRHLRQKSDTGSTHPRGPAQRNPRTTPKIGSGPVQTVRIVVIVDRRLSFEVLFALLYVLKITSVKDVDRTK
jgi:hypothetical protein